MGYSHRYTQNNEFSREKWHAFTKFVDKLSHYKPTICGSDGTGHPVITEDDVMFNGDAGVDEACDTFHVSRYPQPPEFARKVDSNMLGFRFCKTNRKPYDTSVVACLIYIYNIDMTIMNIASDGRISDWHDGLHLCRAIYPDLNLTIPDLD